MRTNIPIYSHALLRIHIIGGQRSVRIARPFLPPHHRKRYVDDTFCILRKGSTEEILHHLNGIRPTIKLTVEQEEDRTLLFLNLLLRRREDGSLDVSVSRKPMHTDQYFHFESHHLTHVGRQHAGHPSEGSSPPC